MIAGLERFFKNFSVFFKKSLKFPQPWPLPILDVQETARQAGRKNFKNIFEKP